MPAFRDFLNHFPIERRNVIGLAAGDQTVVNDDLPIDPAAAGIADIRFNDRPRGERSVTHRVSLDQQPWAVADRRDRLARVDKGANKFYRFRRCAQSVRTIQPTRQKQRVEILRVCFVEGKVNVRARVCSSR